MIKKSQKEVKILIFSYQIIDIQVVEKVQCICEYLHVPKG